MLLLAAPIPTCCLAGLSAQAPGTPVAILRTTATADTVLCPATPTLASGPGASLCAGQGGGYAEDGHLLVRFDDLPAVSARDVLQVRLGLYREWRGNGHDDGDEIVELVVPAPRPFDEASETWATAAAQPEPNATVRGFQAGAQLTAAPRSRLALTTNPTGTGESKFADITEAARGWFDGTRPNDGLLLVTDFAQSAPWVGTAYVTSRDGPVPQRPVLEVTCAARPAGVPAGRRLIVAATGATETEQTAATELRSYLGRVCGERFEIVPEASLGRPAVYVGATEFARRHGLQPEGMSGEELVIRRAGDDLIPCGGRPRGTLYAVAQFLGDHCGLRWLTLVGEEYVPLRQTWACPGVTGASTAGPPASTSAPRPPRGATVITSAGTITVTRSGGTCPPRSTSPTTRSSTPCGVASAWTAACARPTHRCATPTSPTPSRRFRAWRPPPTANSSYMSATRTARRSPVSARSAAGQMRGTVARTWGRCLTSLTGSQRAAQASDLRGQPSRPLPKRAMRPRRPRDMSATVLPSGSRRSTSATGIGWTPKRTGEIWPTSRAG